MPTPLVLIVGRNGPKDVGYRGGTFRAGARYLHAITRSGAAAVIAPAIPDALEQTLASLERVDAVVLHGGGDVDPDRYGEAPVDEIIGVDADSDTVELAVVTEALRLELPVLAICRGMQVLNVALGGSLHQHIGEEHRTVFHDVVVEPGSRVAKAVGPNLLERCSCVHHQALDRLGEGLEVVASTADDVIHAVEVRDARWAVGVQWHPEDTAAEDPRQQALFDALSEQASWTPRTGPVW